ISVTKVEEVEIVFGFMAFPISNGKIGVQFFIDQFDIFGSGGIGQKLIFYPENIIIFINQKSFGSFSVPAGATDFLIIILQTVRQMIMHDIAHIGLVDAHAERIGGNHGFKFFGLPFFEEPVFLVGVQSAVVCGSR